MCLAHLALRSASLQKVRHKNHKFEKWQSENTPHTPSQSDKKRMLKIERTDAPNGQWKGLGRWAIKKVSPSRSGPERYERFRFECDLYLSSGRLVLNPLRWNKTVWPLEISHNSTYKWPESISNARDAFPQGIQENCAGRGSRTLAQTWDKPQRRDFQSSWLWDNGSQSKIPSPEFAIRFVGRSVTSCIPWDFKQKIWKPRLWDRVWVENRTCRTTAMKNSALETWTQVYET